MIFGENIRLYDTCIPHISNAFIHRKNIPCLAAHAPSYPAPSQTDRILLPRL